MEARWRAGTCRYNLCDGPEFMAYTGINREDRLVQATFAAHLEKALGWESVYAWNDETFGPNGTLGRADTREVVLTRDLRAAVAGMNPDLPSTAVDEVVATLTRTDFSRSLLQHNQECYRFIRDGVPVSYRDAQAQLRETRARVIDFQNGRGVDGKPHNRFIAVREMKITGLRAPSYNRRADLVCFVNGLPLVFIELKAVYKNIRAGFDGNLRDYLDENVIAHAFHHNAFLILKELHRIVNEAIRAAAPGDDQAESRVFDISQIDLEKLRQEFAKKATRKATAIEDIRQIVERKLAEMLARNPQRMDYYRSTRRSSPTTTARRIA